MIRAYGIRELGTRNTVAADAVWMYGHLRQHGGLTTKGLAFAAVEEGYLKTCSIVHVHRCMRFLRKDVPAVCYSRTTKLWVALTPSRDATAEELVECGLLTRGTRDFLSLQAHGYGESADAAAG